MRTFANVCGLSVFDLETGSELGKVEDLFIDLHTSQIKGVIIDKKGWLNKDKYIPIESIQQFGSDGVMVSSSNVLKPLLTKSDRNLSSLIEGKNHIRGKPLLTVEGEKLGLVEDVYFREEMGKIIGYEVTEGLLADIKEGKKVVRTDNPLISGEEVLIVKL